MAIKQKQRNYGINEFVLRAFDGDNNVIGRFDDQQTGNLALRQSICPNGANVWIEKYLSDIFKLVSVLGYLCR